MHKAVCRERQAKRMGEEWGRAEDRAMYFAYAAVNDDTRSMQQLIDGLEAALRTKKALAKHHAAAVRAFVNSIDHRITGTAAIPAAGSGSLKALRLLHRHGADLDLADPIHGSTPCGTAAQRGNEASIRLLAAMRADLDAPCTTSGSRSLHCACMLGYTEAAEALLRLRADVNAQDEGGREASWRAASCGHDRCLHLLISARASLAADESGTTPLSVAAQEGRESAVFMLAQARSSLDQPRRDGRTPIAAATTSMHEAVVLLLAHLGARLTLPDGQAFWVRYDTREHFIHHYDLWRRIIDAAGDEAAEASTVGTPAGIGSNSATRGDPQHARV